LLTETAAADGTGADDDDHWICADRSLMTRALVNILNNAVKYSPPDTRIVCSVASPTPKAVPGAARRVSCTIRDQGYGIPKEQQAGLFERFRRFHEAERPEVGGAGLGMAFVKTVVTRHGGDVEVASEPGQGTAFTIRLPVLEDAQSGAFLTPRT
jgi:signal transduction histidine kinase